MLVIIIIGLLFLGIVFKRKVFISWIFILLLGLVVGLSINKKQPSTAPRTLKDLLFNDSLEVIIKEVATTLGYDPLLFKSIAIVESNLNTTAVGKSGEIGLFQISKWEYSLLFHPLVNTLVFGLNFKMLHTKYGSIEKALEVYNTGRVGTKSGKIYTQKVFKVYNIEKTQKSNIIK